MLYDPKWQQTTLQPFTLAHFIGWLEQQPADGTYDWSVWNGGCALCQYAASVTGERVPAFVDGMTTDAYGKAMVLDGKDHFHTPLGVRIAIERPYNFGAALKRAKRLQESMK